MARRKNPPARSPEERQNQLINLAVNEAEQRLMNGTASSQIITTILQWASTKAQLEMEKLRSDIRLSQSKEKEIQAKVTGEEIYAEALNAFRSYQGEDEDDDFE